MIPALLDDTLLIEAATRLTLRSYTMLQLKSFHHNISARVATGVGYEGQQAGDVEVVKRVVEELIEERSGAAR